MGEEKQKKVGWFSKIRDRDDAIKIAKDCGTGFFVIAAIQGGIGLWIAPMLLIDAAVYAVCGFFIRRSLSRAAAVIALLIGLVAVVTTVMNRIGESVGGGNNIILAIIVVWAAIRAVEATFKLNGRFKDVSPTEPNGTLVSQGAPMVTPALAQAFTASFVVSVASVIVFMVLAIVGTPRLVVRAVQPIEKPRSLEAATTGFWPVQHTVGRYRKRAVFAIPR